MKITDIEKIGGVKKTLNPFTGHFILSLTGKYGDDTVEMTSFKGGPIEVYVECKCCSGLRRFVGYLPYLEDTTNVWGEGWPVTFRETWTKVWGGTKVGREALNKKCDRFGEAVCIS